MVVIGQRTLKLVRVTPLQAIFLEVSILNNLFAHVLWIKATTRLIVFPKRLDLQQERNFQLEINNQRTGANLYGSKLNKHMYHLSTWNKGESNKLRELRREIDWSNNDSSKFSVAYLDPDHFDTDKSKEKVWKPP